MHQRREQLPGKVVALDARHRVALQQRLANAVVEGVEFRQQRQQRRLMQKRRRVERVHVRVVAGEKFRDVGGGTAIAAPRQAARRLFTNLRVRVVDPLPQRGSHRVAVDRELPAETERGPVADLGVLVAGHVGQQIDARAGRVLQ
jgi:hypothetical protein